LCSSALAVKASSLFGKVIAVNSGDVITIQNLNRPVRVKLMGVDAPEMNQSFGEVAKKHLSDLVFEKSVIVEYAGIGSDRSLTGRVLLNDADIGAQMIRDGAAWFDPVNGNRLSANDREIYQQSEQAARNEKRGLWQQENPVAPWEFVKAEAMRLKPAPSLKENVPNAKPAHSGPAPELNNLTLIASHMNTAAAPAEPVTPEMMGNLARSSERKNWSVLQPPGEGFSVNVPEGGERVSSPQKMGNQMVDAKAYIARDGWLVYTVMWFKGPVAGETDEHAVQGILAELETVTKRMRGRDGLPGATCELRKQKVDSPIGVKGLELDLTSCVVPTRMRLYTKTTGDERQMYVGMVAGEQDENATHFLNSFRFGSGKTRTR